jgi:hypothetical protein
VKDSSYYEEYITHPRFKKNFANNFNSLDTNSKRYFAYIADVIIATGDKNDKLL